MKSLIIVLFVRWDSIYVSAGAEMNRVQVLEETGYDLTGQLKPEDFLETTIKEQRMTLYIVPGVPEDYAFQTRTRKEISVRLFCRVHLSHSDHRHWIAEN